MWWLLILLLILLISIFISLGKEIPKIIWSYWDTEPIPELIQKCMDTWHKHNPEYKIVLLNKNNIKEYLPDVDILGMKMSKTSQRTSDFIRLHILEKYGGVWSDASIIMNGPIDFIHSNKGYDLVGYHLDGFTSIPESPVIESWFLAAPPGSEFIKKWRECFTKINDFDTAEDYVKSITDQGVNISKIDGPAYLAIHVAAQYVLQKQMTPDEVSIKLYLPKAEDGPYKYLHENGWNIKESVNSLCDKKYTDQPLIKLRGCERGIIEDEGKTNCLFE